MFTSDIGDTATQQPTLSQGKMKKEAQIILEMIKLAWAPAHGISFPSHSEVEASPGLNSTVLSTRPHWTELHGTGRKTDDLPRVPRLGLPNLGS